MRYLLYALPSCLLVCLASAGCQGGAASGLGATKGKYEKPVSTLIPPFNRSSDPKTTRAWALVSLLASVIRF